MTMKRNVYLAQPNHGYGRNFFLPYSIGLLQAYVQADGEIAAHFDFQPMIFKREEIAQVLGRMKAKPPAVLGLSCYIWNFEYNMALARAVRVAFPDCLIVAGGPHIPVLNTEDWPHIDIQVNYEGEKAFASILRKMLVGPTITNVSMKGERIVDLESIPSPYLTGIFDQLIKDNPECDFHASQETHRGCAWSCTFCDWGSAVFTKIRKFADDRIYKELAWISEHKIEMVYNTDANYGMFKRDLEITKAMSRMKKDTGYPKKFRAAYAKNSNDTIFEHAQILHASGMNKGITLSFQSLDEETLRIVKRDNIKISDFKRLMGKYRAAGIATYSEIILGLPGETYETFVAGLDTMLDCGQHESLQVYTCEVLPNAEMNASEYRKQHEIETVRSPIPMFHGTPADDPHQEYYELVVSTKTMPAEDWMRAQMMAWAVQTFHCLGLTQAVAIALSKLSGLPYHQFYECLLGIQEGAIGNVIKQASLEFMDLRKGRPWGSYNPLFGEIIWPPEEAAFLRCVTQKAAFYAELHEILYRETSLDKETVADLVLYQEMLVADPSCGQVSRSCEYDWKSFLDGGSLNKKPVTYVATPAGQYKSLDEFAREVVWYGRKGGSFRNKVERIESI